MKRIRFLRVRFLFFIGVWSIIHSPKKDSRSSYKHTLYLINKFGLPVVLLFLLSLLLFLFLMQSLMVSYHHYPILNDYFDNVTALDLSAPLISKCLIDLDDYRSSAAFTAKCKAVNPLVSLALTSTS
jgi:hypothetical protein